MCNYDELFITMLTSQRLTLFPPLNSLEHLLSKLNNDSLILFLSTNINVQHNIKIFIGQILHDLHE